MGVVLQCNNYDVVDLGVMVPAQKILDASKKEKADVIGLSGLITPSLDEMVNLASEMQRQGFDIPLLIGGATTSRAHTAVKVDRAYKGPVVWVKDASRSVPVVSALLSEEQKPKFVAGVEAEYEQIRERHANKGEREKLLSIDEARANRADIDWRASPPFRPRMLLKQDHAVCEGASCDHAHAQLTYTRVFDDYPLAELRDYIDWQPFFIAWEMKGKFPEILNNPATSETARKLFDDAQAMLDRIIGEKWLTARAVFGLFPAQSRGDDVLVYADEEREQVLAQIHNLRQQGAHREGVPNRCLSDFVAPVDSGLRDYVGAFVVTAGIGIEERVKAFKAAHDDYNAILLESLADRLAEALAERLHQRVRKEFWGYASDEVLDNPALIAEKYAGIRPAPGYAACPEHTQKETLFTLLDAEQRIGVRLTESMAMWPGASVSGWYYAHPQSQYFVLGRVGRDQVEDYAQRKGWTLQAAEKWLSPNLAYEPES